MVSIRFDLRSVISAVKITQPAIQYLLPHERELVRVRRHPAILLGPIFAVIFGLLVPLAAIGLFKLSGEKLLAVWLAWGLLIIRLAWKVTSWLVDYYIVTSARMLVVRGVFARDVAMIPFDRMLDLNIQRSGRGSLFGYGCFLVDVVDPEIPMWKIDFLPYPEQLFREVYPAILSYLP